MKMFFKLVISFVIVASLCLSANPIVSSETIATSQAWEIEYMRNEMATDSRLAYEFSAVLTDYFETTYHSIYPTSYAGCYIDDNQDFVICVTKNGNQAEYTNLFTESRINTIRNNFLEALGTTSNSVLSLEYSKRTPLKYQNATYSFNELYSLFSLLQSNIHNWDILSIDLSQKNNCIYVTVSSEDIAANIRQHLDKSSYVDVANAVQYKISSASTSSLLSSDPSSATSPLAENASQYLYAGNEIRCNFVNSLYDFGTVCFNATHYETGQRGFVTCQHVVGANTVVKTVDGNVINNASSPKNIVSETLDASFVPFASTNWLLSSSIDLDGTYQGSLLRICLDSSLIEGATVYKFGATTDGSYGTIESLFYTEELFPEPHIRTNCPVQKGDSGSPLLIKASVMQGNQYELVGMIRYRNPVTETFKYSCAIPIKRILFALDLKPIMNTAFYRIGDADGDEDIDTTDYQLVLQYAVGKDSISGTYVPSVDVDMNKIVNTTDARLILQKTEGTLEWLT